MRITVGELRALIVEAKGSKWIKAKEDKFIAAIKALPRHPLAGHPDIAKLVWDLPIAHGNLDPAKFIRSDFVKTSMLHPTQDEVSKKHLIWLLQHDSERRSEKPKVVLKKSGNYLVADGHHRVTLAIIEGGGFIEVDLYEQE